MKKLSAKILWIIVAVLFLAAIGVVIWIANANEPLNKILIGVMVVLFISITILVQVASYRMFKNKPMIKYITKEYNTDINDYDKYLKDNNYQYSKRNYGNSYLKIDNGIAYKISLINNVDAYFKYEEDNVSVNKELDKCKAFIGLEIFDYIDDVNLKKLTEFTIQTNKLYYTALIKMDNGNYKCLNYEKPNEIFEEPYNNIFKELHLSEKNDI